MNVKIIIVRDTASPALAELAKLVEDQAGILGAAGHRLVRDTAQHVRQWGLSHPNKLGGPRTNYWSGIAEKINPADTLEVAGKSATVTLGGPTMPGLMRAFGDVTITPGTKTPGAKYLALPARSESYGKRPGEFNNLVVFWGKNGPAGLMEAPATKTTLVPARQNKKGETVPAHYSRGQVTGGLVMFWFAKSVTQPQDRSLLPTAEEWSESATAGAREHAEQFLRRLNGGAA